MSRSLVSSTPLLVEARTKSYGIVAFNIHTLEMLQAVVEAAEECQAPVIIQSTVGTVKHLGMHYIVAAAQVAARHASVPIALHLDHCQDVTLIKQCIQAGYTSVMIDASKLRFEDNVSCTQEVVAYAKQHGVNVEAELGKIGGVEDDIVVSDADVMLAIAEECEHFLELTGVHTLAPAIGTAHGIYKGEPNIDFARIEQIATRVAVPLVLHGGSGIPAEQVRRCVALGMAKMNVATELKNTFSQTIQQFFIAHPQELDPRQYMVPAKQAVKQMAMDKIKLCGSAGRA